MLEDRDNLQFIDVQTDYCYIAAPPPHLLSRPTIAGGRIRDPTDRSMRIEYTTIVRLQYSSIQREQVPWMEWCGVAWSCLLPSPALQIHRTQTLPPSPIVILTRSPFNLDTHRYLHTRTLTQAYITCTSTQTHTHTHGERKSKERREARMDQRNRTEERSEKIEQV